MKRKLKLKKYRKNVLELKYPEELSKLFKNEEFRKKISIQLEMKIQLKSSIFM